MFLWCLMKPVTICSDTSWGMQWWPLGDMRINSDEIYSWVWMRSSRVWMRSSRVWMRSSRVWMRSGREWIRSSRVFRASGCQCLIATILGFDSSILRHSGIWGAAEEAGLNKVHKKFKNLKKSPFRILSDNAVMTYVQVYEYVIGWLFYVILRPAAKFVNFILCILSAWET
jgi:hypothetical protein